MKNQNKQMTESKVERIENRITLYNVNPWSCDAALVNEQTQ